MTESSIDREYSRALFFREDNVNQDNPANLPLGFHYIATSNGKVLGFYCGRCKLQLVGAPDEVKHCGTVSRMPTGRLAKLVSRLKTIKLKRYR